MQWMSLVISTKVTHQAHIPWSVRIPIPWSRSVWAGTSMVNTQFTSREQWGLQHLEAGRFERGLPGFEVRGLGGFSGPPLTRELMWLLHLDQVDGDRWFWMEVESAWCSSRSVRGEWGAGQQGADTSGRDMAGRYSYRDLAHPSLQDTLKNHNYSTLKLVKTGESTTQPSVVCGTRVSGT